MSTKHIRTGGDLVRFGATVRLECTDCGRAGELDALTFVRACGSGPLYGAAKRLKCTSCGARRAKLSVADTA